jgi:hypothetical protein
MKMKTIVCVSLCLLFLSAQCTDWGYNCYTYLDETDNFYNLNPLQTADTNKYQVTIENFIPTDLLPVPVTANILFNVCGTRDKTQEFSGCNNGQNSVGFISYLGSCYSLSRNAGNQNTVWSQSPINKNDKNEDGVIFYADNSQTQGSAIYNVSFIFKCDTSISSAPSISASQDGQTKDIILTIAHENACGVGFGPFSDFQNWKWPLIVVGFLFGIVMCFMGFRAFKYCLAFIGFVVGFIVPFVLLSIAWKDVDHSNKIYFILAVSFLLACMAAYFVYMMRDVGFFAAGTFLGIVLSLQLYILFIYRWEKEGSSVLLYVTCGVLGLIGGILAVTIKKYSFSLTLATF